MADPVSIAIQVGLAAVNMALTASRRIEGPRLNDLNFTSGDYGASLPMVWGKRRLSCPIFWAENLKEVKQTRKTKGGKYNDYTYFGTWAIALAGHQIGGVTRIWFDKHLAYDTTGAGPITPLNLGTGTITDYITIYLGTETQDVDPRMAASVEAKHGEGTCPAYRGTAYIVFKDLPLDKLGNRIPQVDVEMVGTAVPAYPWESHDTLIAQPDKLFGFTFAPDHSRFMWNDGNNIEIWDTAARARMIKFTTPASLYAPQNVFGLRSDGSFIAPGPLSGVTNQWIYQFSADGTSALGLVQVPDFTHDQTETRVRTDAAGTEHWMGIPWSTNRYFYVDGTPLRMIDLTGVDWQPTEYFTDEEGSIWTVGRVAGIGVTTAYFYRLIAAAHATGPSYLAINGLPANGNIFSACTAACGAGGFVLCWNLANLYRIDRQSGTVTTSRTGLTLSVYNTAKQFANLTEGASSVWLGTSEIDLTTLATKRTVNLFNWLSEDAAGIIYDPINNALICAPQFNQRLTWRYLDRLGSGAVTLGEIAADVAAMVGVPNADFSSLTQTVQGWSATRGQASNILEPLFDAFDSDIRPHDFTVQGIRRTGVSVGTLATPWFVAANPRYTVSLTQAASLPRSLSISFADVTADQQPNNVTVARPLVATEAQGDQTINLNTLASDPTEMRGLTERYFRRLWNSRKTAGLALTAQQLALEPGDVRALQFDDESFVARCTKATFQANGQIATEWAYDDPSLALLSTSLGASFDGRDASVVAVPLLSKGFVLDTPLISDADNHVNPIVYLLAAPYAAGAWPGAGVFQAIGGEYSDDIGDIATGSRATWGYATTVLGDANPNLWDRLGSVNVMLQVGTLAGTTEAAIDASPTTNLALIGNEFVNFTTAHLETDGSYTLSGFKRGRRGTEWATAGHALRDVFLLLDVAAATAMSLSEVGTNLSFKAITAGRTESGAFPIPLAPYTGASLKPYAACHLAAAKDAGTGDWALTWVRRTRVGGAWTSGTAIPLSEASEAYVVEILNGSTVVRTITGLTSPAATWTAAQQTTDFGSAQSSVHFRVYQLSDAVGRGFAAEATF